MDPFNSNSSTPQRSSSLRRSLRLSTNSARDEEEYDLTEAAVVDGFRPNHPEPTFSSSSSPSTSTSPSLRQTASHSASSHSASQTTAPSSTGTDLEKPAAPAMLQRPSSTAKPPRPHDSLTLRNDGSSSLGSIPLISQSQTASPDAPQIRPQSPYRGPTGPSHPYQMYPQRTLSNATASTRTPVTRNSYDGPQGPTHPYALYTQNIVPSGEENQSQSIPVGFTRTGDNYRRQLGPDGEEAGDLIGPLGHTEELPPYTRYPDESPVAKTTSDTLQDEREAESPANVSPHPIDGAGGIGVATRNPEFSSTEEDLQASRSRPSTTSQHDINTAAQDAAEKPRMNKWQRRAKKKLWGIVPYWAICLLVIGVVIIGIIMGAVIGTVLSHHKAPQDPGQYNDPSQYQPTPSPTLDVMPLATVPPGLPPLATGSYMLPPLVASQAPKSCLNYTNQNIAWSCDVPFRYYSLDVHLASQGGDTECYDVNLTTVTGSGYTYLWGTQIPNIPHETLQLVNDTFEPRRSPAWWVKVTYDKTVILPADSFSVSSKRSDSSEPQGVNFGMIQTTKKKSIGAEDGDKAWICTWPGTTLEVFIYPTQNASTALKSSSTTTQPASASATAAEDNPYPSDPPPPYPKAVKFVENRDSDDNAKAYCRQVQVIDDGHGMVNLTDVNNQPIEIIIIENKEDYKQDAMQRQAGYHLGSRSWYNPVVARGTYELTPCGCLWWSS